MIDTPMRIDATPEEYVAVAGQTPIGRIAKPSDVARGALFRAGKSVCFRPESDH
jgi:3-oxoacyl-[acyl-carrier protein] reductase